MRFIESDQKPKRRGVIFNPEITLGHIFQLGAMCVTVAVIYGNTREERLRSNLRITAVEEAVQKAVSRLAQHDEILARMAVNHERITTLLEERTRSNGKVN